MKFLLLKNLSARRRSEANFDFWKNRSDSVLEIKQSVKMFETVPKYDAFARLVEGTDARGVKTNFIEYDTLNRIKKITYSDGTPQVNYTYDQARSDPFSVK